MLRVIVLAFAAAAAASPAASFDLAVTTTRAGGRVMERDGVEQLDAEIAFAGSEAAVWFPETGRMRWLSGAGEPAEFIDAVERDYPQFRFNAHGAYVLKVSATSKQRPHARPEAVAEPAATVFTESFENGLGNWSLEDNTGGAYAWGSTTCEARSGSRSADATRGGTVSLDCSQAYTPDLETDMVHRNCEALAGASQAWLDAYIHVASESGYDRLSFYYDGNDGYRYGTSFSGNFPAWFHVVFNLKQWYKIGDVTATPCPRLNLEFETDDNTQQGFGARVDDLTVSTHAPSFLTCAINASRVAGFAPLTVQFTATASPTSSSTTYRWRFDAGGPEVTTPSASYTFTTPGTYSVGLRVSNSGVYAYARQNVTVTAAPAARRRSVRPPGNPVTNYVLTTSSNPANGGGTSGNGTYPANTLVTVHASPSPGHLFSHWTDASTSATVSTSSSYPFLLTSNRTLVANFVQNTVNYTLSLSVSPPGAGTTTGGGSFAANSSVTAQASANGGYTFTSWTDSSTGATVSNSSSYTFQLTSNRTLVANFTPVQVNYTISLSASPQAGGSVTGAGTFAANTQRLVTASANNGYVFTNWTEGGSVVSNSSSYAFTLTSNRTLSANFSASANSLFFDDFSGGVINTSRWSYYGNGSLMSMDASFGNPAPSVRWSWPWTSGTINQGIESIQAFSAAPNGLTLSFDWKAVTVRYWNAVLLAANGATMTVAADGDRVQIGTAGCSNYFGADASMHRYELKISPTGVLTWRRDGNLLLQCGPYSNFLTAFKLSFIGGATQSPGTSHLDNVTVTSP